MADCLTFIHLSDIHFSTQSGETLLDLDSGVRHELERDVGSVIPNIGRVTGLLVTGDIAFSGTSDEYVKAREWLTTLCRQAKCPEEAVWVVPGNHDIDRRTVAKSKAIRVHRRALRAVPPDSIDAELAEYCLDPSSGRSLLEPLAAYNAFAALYGCDVKAKELCWEHALVLASGTVVRLRGLSSVIVSDSEDAKGNIILGSAQADVRREAGVEYVTLCHHPPDWLLDQEACTDHLNPKVRVQLYDTNTDSASSASMMGFD